MSHWYEIPADETTVDDRESLIDAALAQLAQEEPELWAEAASPLAGLREALAGLTRTLPDHPDAVHWLLQAVEAAAGRVAVEKQMNLFGDYAIRYGEGVSGPPLLAITDNELDYTELRISGSQGVPASRSLSLLVGELFEAHAERLLTALDIDGTSVRAARPLRKARRRQDGRRIDDWLVELPDGREIPVEVKATRSVSYLQEAFGQLAAVLQQVEEALLVGILYADRETDAAHHHHRAEERQHGPDEKPGLRPLRPHHGESARGVVPGGVEAQLGHQQGHALGSGILRRETRGR